MTYLDDLKEFNELRDGMPLVSIQTYPSFDAPSYDLTGGTSLCGTLEEAMGEIEKHCSVVWSVGFEDNPDHQWNLVGYEVFVPQKLVTKGGSLHGHSIHNGAIFCYYRPVKPEVIEALIQGNQLKSRQMELT